MSKLQNKAKVLGDLQEITDDFEGTVKFSRMVSPDEAEMLKEIKFANHMHDATGFERPPAGFLFWSRELLLLSGEIGPDMDFSVRDMVKVVLDKLIADYAKKAFNHALNGND